MTDRAYRHIRTRLATGVLRSGSQLSEVNISQEIGVGRTPVREAFLLLENEGFIEQIPRYGTFVKKPSRHERQSLYELREVLESYAAGKAAEYMTADAVARLGELCEQIHQAVRAVRDNGGRATDEAISQVAIADLAFHMLILRASGNPFVTRTLGDMHLMTRIWGGPDRGDPSKMGLNFWVTTWREHARIVRAIRRRDPAAAHQAMQAHLRCATVKAMENYDHQCRAEGAEALGYEWPAEVRQAISRLEEYGPDAIEGQAGGNG